MTRRNALLLLAAIFLIPSAALFAPVLLGQRLYAEQFHIFFFEAQRFLAWDLHQLPNWWPNFFSGYPISLTLDGFLNPLFLIVLKFVPVIPAYNWLVYIFFVLNIWSCYALARAFGMSRAAAIVATFAYSYSGILMEWTDLIVFTNLFCVLPLSLLCCLRIHEGRKHWRIIWTALLVYAWFCGFTEVQVYNLIAVGSFCVTLMLTRPIYAMQAWRAAPGKTALAFFKEGFLHYALPLIISLIIVSPWLVSVLYFILSRSNRAAGLAVETASAEGLTLSHLIHTLLPRLSVPYGGNIPVLRLNDNDYHLFIGTLPMLFLAIFPFLNGGKPRWVIRFFFGLMAFGLLMAFRSPVYLFVHSLPVLRWFSQHSKWYFLVVLSAGMLAGFATDAFLKLERTRALQRMVKILTGLFIAATLAVGMVTIFAGKLEQTFFSIAKTHYQAAAQQQNQSLPRTAEYYDAILRELSHSFVHAFSFRDGWTLVMFLLWAMALGIIAIHVFRPHLPPSWMRYLVVGGTILGCTIPWGGFLIGNTPDYLNEEPASVTYLHKENAYRTVPVDASQEATHIPYRIFIYIPDQTYAYLREIYGSAITLQQMPWFARELLENNTNAWYQVDGSFNHEPLGDRGVLAMFHEAGGPKGATSTQAFRDGIAKFSTDHNARLLGAWNVKYVTTPLELGAPWKHVFTSQATDLNINIHIYENPWFQPRWHFAETVRYVRGEARNLQPEELLRIPSNFSTETLIETPSDDVIPHTNTSSSDRLSLINYTAGRLDLKTETAAPRWVVLTESASPFWRAEVDGQPVPVSRANTAFVAAWVPAGAHTLTFRYAGFWEQSRQSTVGLMKMMSE